MDNLKNSLIYIEKQINNKISCFSTQNYYDFVDFYSEDILILIDNIDDDLILNFFQDDLKNIEIFNIKYPIFLNDKTKYLKSILCVFIVKSFINIKSFKTNDFDTSFSNLLFESDSIINSILKDVFYFKIWLNIFLKKKNFIFDSKKKRLQIAKIFYILKEKKKIKINLIRVGSKTINFYDLEIKRKNFFFCELYTKKFDFYCLNNEMYICSDHYINTSSLYRKNKLSGYFIKIKKNNFIKNLRKIKAKIDYDLLYVFYKKKIEKMNINEDEIYSKYNDIINCIKEELKKNINNIDSINVISEYNKLLSEIGYLIRIKQILNNKKDNFFYFNSFMCFRGRLYYGSDISFTSYKEFRSCLHLGEYNDNNFNYKFHKLNKKIENVLDSRLHYLEKIKNYDFSKKDRIIKHSILWIMISASEIYKKELGDEVVIDKFIEKGISILNDEIDDKLDEYDFLKIYTYKKILNEINNDIYIQRLISKDATASGIQHLVKILGESSEIALLFCNMNSEDTWYDTYAKILNLWISKNKNFTYEDNILINKYFSRKTIKRPLMTSQYGASFGTTWKYFKDEAKINYEDIDNTRKLFKKFYDYINTTIGILDRDSRDIIEKLKSTHNFIIKTTDSLEANLIYYKTKKTQIKISYNKKIITKKSLEIKNEIDIRKTKTSSRANYIHVIDAALVRHIISKTPILTVHDCFLERYSSITYIVALVNDAMRLQYHDLGICENKKKKIFSIFIIL